MDTYLENTTPTGLRAIILLNLTQMEGNWGTMSYWTLPTLTAALEPKEA